MRIDGRSQVSLSFAAPFDESLGRCCFWRGLCGFSDGSYRCAESLCSETPAAGERVPTPEPIEHISAVSRLAGVDWLVLLGYGALLVVTGWLVSRRKHDSTEDYFLGGRNVPAWAVAISVLATSLSAATFIGGPEQSYRGSLTYLSANIGAIIAVLVVAAFFIPVFYRYNVSTVYELLERRFGPRARLCSSVMYMLGRVLASGSRVYIAAIPASLIVFGDIEARHVLAAVLLFMIAGIGYTFVGGVASVIWTDVIQTVVFVGAAVIAAAVLLDRIPIGAGELVDVLRTPGDGAPSKLALLDVSVNPSSSYTVWTALTGFVLFNIAAYGTDHDLAQRTLTCKSALKGSRSVIGAILVGLPVTFVFMLIGLLLFVFYNRPDVMGAAGPHAGVDDTREVFLNFILNELPAGLPGLMMAGLFAAGLSTINSSLNAMASAFTNDVYKHVVRGRADSHYLLIGRAAVIGWGVVLTVFAGLCMYWHQSTNQSLIDFALSVMTYAYPGLLAVFLVAIFTRLGNSVSAIAALVVGTAMAIYLTPGMFESLKPAFLVEMKPAYPWRLLASTAVALVVCISGPAGMAADGLASNDEAR